MLVPLVIRTAAAQALDPSAAAELSVGPLTVVSVTPSGQFLEVAMTASVTNADCADLRSVVATLRSVPPPFVTVLDRTLDFGDVAPDAAGAVTADTVVFRFPTAKRARFRDWVVAPKTWSYAGVEEPVLAPAWLFYEPFPAEVRVDLAARRTEVVFYPLTCDAPDAPLLWDVFYGDAGFPPFTVESAPCDPWTHETVVEGPWVDLADLYSCGTFAGATQWTAHGDQEGADGWWDGACDPTGGAACAMGSWDGLMVGFDDVEVWPGVRATGQVGVGDVDLAMGVTIRDQVVTSVTTRLSTEARYTAALRAMADASAGTETTVWSVSLPMLTVPLGGFPVYVVPTLDLFAGASGEVRTGMEFGVTQAAAFGLDATWVGDPVGVTAWSEPLYGVSSGPTLDGTVSATGRLYAGMEASLLVNGLAGPSLRGTPWVEVGGDGNGWTLESGVDLDGEFELSVFGADVARELVPLASATVFHRDGAYGAQGTNQDLRWARRVDFDAAGSEGGSRVLSLSDGGAIVTTAADDGYAARLTPTGDLSWALAGDFRFADQAMDAVELPGGHVLFVAAGTDVFNFVEVDATGAVVLEHQVDPGSWRNATSLDLELADDGTLRLGLTWSASTAPFDPGAVVASLGWDSVGGATFAWARRFEAGLASADAGLVDLVVLADGGVVWVGGLPTDDGGGLVVRLDAAGDEVWSTLFETGNNAIDLEGVVELPGGGFAVVGERNPDTYFVDDARTAFLAVLDDDGGWAWHTTFSGDPEVEQALYGYDASVGFTAYDAVTAVATDGTLLYVSGTTGLGGIRDQAAWLAAFDLDGAPMWIDTFEVGLRQVDAQDLSTGPRGLLATGTATFADTFADAWVVRSPVEGGLGVAGGDLTRRRTMGVTQELPDAPGGLLSDWYAISTPTLVVTDLAPATWTSGVSPLGFTDVTAATLVTELR